MGDTVNVTTIGPVATPVRDAVAQYRDDHDHPNYNEAVRALLQEADSGV